MSTSERRYTFVGKDWSHAGVASLYKAVSVCSPHYAHSSLFGKCRYGLNVHLRYVVETWPQENGYEILYLSSRAIGMAPMCVTLAHALKAQAS